MVARVAMPHAVGVIGSILPETALEREQMADPRLCAGLAGGTPRVGHPEGRVADHVASMLSGIAPDDRLCGDLRVLAIVHDASRLRSARTSAGRPTMTTR
jgi:hypothetical protein